MAAVDDLIEMLKLSMKFEQDAFKIMAADPENYAMMAQVYSQSLQDRVPMWDMLGQYGPGDDYTAFSEALDSLYRVQTAARQRRIAAWEAKP